MKVNFHLDKKNKPHSENGMTVLYGQAKRSGYRLRWYLILAIVISPLLFMSYYLFRTQILVTAPGIVTSYPLTITSPQSATVDDLLTTIGAEISNEQPLIVLKNKILDQEVDFLHQELSKLSNIEQPNSNSLYQLAISNTKKSVKKVDAIQQKYDRFRSDGQVSDVDYASMVNVSNAMHNQLSAQEIAYVNEQQQQVQQQLAGPISQQYRALKQELVVKETQQNNLMFTAPFTGRVLDIHVHEGQRVTENAPLLTLAQNITPEIIVFLNPKYLEYGTLNTRATVIFPDGKKFAATVSRPVELVNTLPPELQSPFEGQSAYLKLILSFDERLEKTRWIEGVEVEVRF